MALVTLIWVFGIAPMVFVLAVYRRLPRRVVIHWNLQGRPNGNASRLALLVFTLIAPATAWLFLEGPARELVRVQPAFLYFDAVILAIVCVSLIAATLLNLIRRPPPSP